jgi:hypothetical protein
MLFKVRICYLTIILLFLFCIHVFGQNESAVEKSNRQLFIGYSAGLNLSEFIQGGDWSGPHYYSLSVTLENRYTAGFYASVFGDFPLSKSFSLQPEISYKHTKHDIKFSQWQRIGVIGTTKDANYSVMYSRIVITLLPKITLGNKVKLGIFAGPYFDLPFFINHEGTIAVASWNETTRTQISNLVLNDDEIKNEINSGLGFLSGFRINFPLKDDYICTEFRYGKSLYYIIETPDIEEKQITLSVIYLWKLRL